MLGYTSNVFASASSFEKKEREPTKGSVVGNQIEKSPQVAAKESARGCGAGREKSSAFQQPRRRFLQQQRNTTVTIQIKGPSNAIDDTATGMAADRGTACALQGSNTARGSVG